MAPKRPAKPAPAAKPTPAPKASLTLNDQLEKQVKDGLTNLDFVIHFHLTGKTPSNTPQIIGPNNGNPVEHTGGFLSVWREWLRLPESERDAITAAARPSNVGALMTIFDEMTHEGKTYKQLILESENYVQKPGGILATAGSMLDFSTNPTRLLYLKQNIDVAKRICKTIAEYDPNPTIKAIFHQLQSDIIDPALKDNALKRLNSHLSQMASFHATLNRDSNSFFATHLRMLKTFSDKETDKIPGADTLSTLGENFGKLSTAEQLGTLGLGIVAYKVVGDNMSDGWMKSALKASPALLLAGPKAFDIGYKMYFGENPGSVDKLERLFSLNGSTVAASDVFSECFGFDDKITQTNEHQKQISLVMTSLVEHNSVGNLTFKDVINSAVGDKHTPDMHSLLLTTGLAHSGEATNAFRTMFAKMHDRYTSTSSTNPPSVAQKAIYSLLMRSEHTLIDGIARLFSIDEAFKTLQMSNTAETETSRLITEDELKADSDLKDSAPIKEDHADLVGEDESDAIKERRYLDVDTLDELPSAHPYASLFKHPNAQNEGTDFNNMNTVFDMAGHQFANFKIESTKFEHFKQELKTYSEDNGITAKIVYIFDKSRYINIGVTFVHTEQTAEDFGSTETVATILRKPLTTFLSSEVPHPYALLYNGVLKDFKGTSTEEIFQQLRTGSLTLPQLKKAYPAANDTHLKVVNTLVQYIIKIPGTDTFLSTLAFALSKRPKEAFDILTGPGTNWSKLSLLGKLLITTDAKELPKELQDRQATFQKYEGWGMEAIKQLEDEFDLTLLDREILNTQNRYRAVLSAVAECVDGNEGMFKELLKMKSNDKDDYIKRIKAYYTAILKPKTKPKTK